MRVNYGQNVYNKEEINAVVKTLKSGTQMGRSVAKFEQKLSKIFGKKYSRNCIESFVNIYINLLYKNVVLINNLHYLRLYSQNYVYINNKIHFYYLYE